MTKCYMFSMMKEVLKFFYEDLAIFKDSLKCLAFKYLFGMMRDGSLSAVGISSPNFVASLPLAIEAKTKFSNYINYFFICDSRKMFAHDRYLYCDGYRYLEAELMFTFSNNRREKFTVIFSTLNVGPNYILDVINNLGIRIAFSMASLKCQTFCKISSLFTRFNYYWKKIYLFHGYSLIHNVKKVKGNFLSATRIPEYSNSLEAVKKLAF